MKPMLAHVYTGECEFPCMVQPKLDGVRCLEINRSCMSRNEKPLHTPPCMARLPGSDVPLDGELYIPGYTFNEIVSIVKRKDHINNHLLQYHVYDCVMPGTFMQRSRIVFNLLKDCGPNIVLVPTVEVTNKVMLDDCHASMVHAGYEGSIIRDPSSVYTHGRSKGLLKRKDFMDSEFRVLDIFAGEGKNSDCAILQLEGFTATAPGNYAFKQQILKDKDTFIGQLVTIKYQGLSEDGIPRFPVAVGFPIDK